MKLFKVKSLDELKTLGKHKDIAEKIKEILGKEVEIKTRSWQELYETICNNRELLKNKLLKNIKSSKKDKSLYFVSREAEIIFYLLELDGETRLKMLKVNKGHFNNKRKAAKWKNDLEKLIDPEKCTDLNAIEAINELNNIYDDMIQNKE